MRILITGSSGEIGTNLGLRLLELGHEVFGVDKRENTWTNKIPTTIQDLSQRFTPLERHQPQSTADPKITDGTASSPSVGREARVLTGFTDFSGGIGFARRATAEGGVKYPEVDLVVHLAANAKVHELVKFPERAMDNINITFNVLEFCRANSLPIIFSSSREVYGDIHRYITDEKQSDFYFTESPYSASKISGEALIYSYARCYGLKYLVFRFSNVYGRYDSDIERMERVTPLFINRIYAGEPVTVFGEKKTLDFTYIDDCVAGVVRGIEKLSSGEIQNQTINLAYGEGHTLIELVKYIGRALGKNPEMQVEPQKQVGEVSYYIADIGKARKLLEYNPETNLEAGVNKAVAWWKEYYHHI